ncbi:MerR family transcriptional regulator [Paenibacillus sinopodophylli]|uniref:MerR family transcriptional regulator n=1 Tax=Paenibacillus sinopodophylli TaxID=1837342 RepID=UPI00110D1CE9|nr:MerR family transcriptional regulator [Paenibacillus sinopodophylli]
MYAISQLSKLLGISTYALRYYETEGIVAPDRNAQGERVYREADVEWLRFVLRLKETKMSIAQIKQYARLVAEGEHTREDRLQLLETHRTFIRQQLESLTTTEQMLDYKINFYQSHIMKKSLQSQQ